MNKKNNKDNNDTTPSLDLSFAYGTTVLKQLSASDLQRLSEQEAEQEISSGDTTIRAVTSLYTGKRNIVNASRKLVADDSD